MKQYLIILPVLVAMAGCAGSNIKIPPGGEKQGIYNMFGKVPSRDFYYPVSISDSLIFKWDAEANGGFTQSSVTFYKDNVFINDLSGRITSFDINTGDKKGQLKHSGAIYTTPVIYKYNLIYIETMDDEDKSILHIHNFLEGRQVAASEFTGRVKTEILMFNERIYFITEKGLLYKFSHIGDMYWVKDVNSSVNCSPVSDGKSIYISTDAREIICINAEDGNIDYRKNTDAVITSGLVLSGDTIFAGDKEGQVYFIDKSTGRIKWKYKTRYRINAFPVINDGTVYIVNLGGDVVSINLNTFRDNWNINSGGVNNITPLLTDNYLIVPDLKGRLIFIDILNGQIKNIITLPNRAKLSPVIYGNILFTGYDRGILRAYEIL